MRQQVLIKTESLIDNTLTITIKLKKETIYLFLSLAIEKGLVLL